MHPAHVKRKKGCTMKVELKSGAVRLGANQTLKIVDGAGRTVCAEEGAVWITEENVPKDIVLERGGCYQLRAKGLTIVNALGGAASVSLA
jgi:hypothetical protein